MVNHAVVFAMRRNKVLLARHLEGTHFGALLPPSGKVKPSDQSIEIAGTREAWEELDILITNPRCVGVVEILKEGGKNLRLFIIIAKYLGTPRGSNEMEKPHLYSIKNLPIKDMWPDASHWVRRVINHNHHAPPIGLRLRLKRGPNNQTKYHVARFNPDAVVRRLCA